MCNNLTRSDFVSGSCDRGSIAIRYRLVVRGCRPSRSIGRIRGEIL